MAGEDKGFRTWVQQQPCLVCRELCELQKTRTEADHVGDRALGKRAHDRSCIPLCTEHHRDRHDCRGFFADRLKNRSWLEWAMCETNRRYGRQQAGGVM